ncbi:MAG: phosphonate ABC transporter ATP-binding protein [Bdellovibrionales bacterium RBG_16_40_8]|nr:MAG: phosphonate ABC transporter ATP-binding protein [Bdellovibrionales bacterium RBG_16_40_8]
MISVKNLTKEFSSGVCALNNISFNVNKGEFLVVIGLSGSGKSTLMRCLNRLYDPTAGEIYFHNEEISKLKGRAIRVLRQRMAMIFQHFNLISRHTVLSNVLMGCLARTSTIKSIMDFFSNDDKELARSYLKLVGIEDKALERAGQLSGGQQQRVAIARALMQKPEVLLADEPVASLDPATCHVVLDYLEKINRELGLTIICNLHFLSLVRRYATRVIALKSGEIVYEGDPQAINEEWFKKIYGETAREIYVK